MKKTIPFLLLCYALSFTGCSGDEEEKKSSVDSFTEETAQKAVEYIQDPLDKARAVQQLVDEHSSEIKQTIGDEDKK
jgi:PBP1b-binding outer membrane lipoprotein LpoB